MGTDPATTQAIYIIFARPLRIMRYFKMGTLGTDPKFSVCVTLPRRSIVRERAGSAASAKRQGRCDGCIFMAGIISKNQSARQARSSHSLAPTRMRREAMPLDNAREFHSKSTVAVPEVRAARSRRPCYIVCASYRNCRLRNSSTASL